MLARRVSPASPLALFGSDVDRIFSDFFNAPLRASLTGRTDVSPAINVREDEENIHVEADVPGLKLEDLSIEIVDNELTITGKNKEDQEEEKEGGYHIRERRHGKFSRRLRLPIPLDASKAEAELRDGVLKVTLPKHEAVRSRKIEVKAVK
jgi:HSP20 family protein